MQLSKRNYAAYTPPRPQIVMQDDISPSRRFVLQTSHVWAPSTKVLASPSRGLRTADMPQPTASILHSGNAYLFSNINAPQEINGRAVLTLSEEADLTLNHIEAGFAPQKLCTRLKKLGVLVPRYVADYRPEKALTLHQRLCKTELPRSLPRTHFRPFASECAHFFPYSVATLADYHIDVQTDSLHRSFVTASVANFRFADHLPQVIPGADLVAQEKAPNKRWALAANCGSTGLGLEKAIPPRKVCDSTIFSRLDEFESRQNAAQKRSAELISQLCVDCSALKLQALDAVNATVLAARREDEAVSEWQAQARALLESGSQELGAQGVYFNAELADSSIRTVVFLLKSDVVTKIKALMLECNCITQTRTFSALMQAAALLQVSGVHVRDAFYQFFQALASRSLAVFFANKKAHYSPQFCIALAVVCRLNYAACAPVLALAVAKLGAILRAAESENDADFAQQSTMRALLHNSLARNTQFACEHDRLTISVQGQQEDELIARQCEKLLSREWSFCDEVCYTILVVYNAIFGVLQLILAQQEALRKRTRVAEYEVNASQQQVREFYDVLASVLQLLDEAAAKCAEDPVYRRSEVDELFLALLGHLDDGQIYLCDYLMQSEFLCAPSWIAGLKAELARLISE